MGQLFSDIEYSNTDATKEEGEEAPSRHGHRSFTSERQLGRMRLPL